MSSVLDVFRDSAGKLRARRQRVSKEIEDARKRREELHALPLPASERAELLCARVDRQAEEYARRFRVHTEFLRRKPFAKVTDKPIENLFLASLAHKPGDLAGIADLNLAFAYYLGDAMKAGIRKALAQDPAESGPPRAKREAELSQLEQSIAKLEAEEREIHDDVTRLRAELD